MNAYINYVIAKISETLIENGKVSQSLGFQNSVKIARV